MNAQEIHTDDGESKAAKRKWKRRPPSYSGGSADTTDLPFAIRHMACHTSGWTLERVGALMRFIQVVWRTQQPLPRDLSELTHVNLRGYFGMDVRTARRFLADKELCDLVRDLCAKRAPLCDGAREEIFGKSDGRCHHCGTELDPANFHIDHLVAIVRGGLTHKDNLVASCPPCNLSKGARVS